MKHGLNHSTAGPLKIASEGWEELSFSSFFSLSDECTLHILCLRHRESPFTVTIMLKDSKSFFHVIINRRNWVLIIDLVRSGKCPNVKNWKTEQELWLLLTLVLFTEVLSLQASNFNIEFCQMKTNEFPIYETNKIALYSLFIPTTCGMIICFLKGLLCISELQC